MRAVCWQQELCGEGDCGRIAGQGMRVVGALVGTVLQRLYLHAAQWSRAPIATSI